MTRIVVIGGGLAGATTALTLARLGYQPIVIEAGLGFKIGEGLPPAARRLLMWLGVWEAFLKDGHLPSYSNQSAWGGGKLRTQDFTMSPDGHGWHVDRFKLESLLLNQAASEGVRVWHPARLRDVESHGAGWRLTLSDGEHLEADWLIDASGRTRRLTRQLGVAVTKYDSLLAFVGVFTGEDSHNSTLIEALPDGWAYTARIPWGRRVAVYHTDTAIPPASLPDILNETTHIRARLHGYQLSERPFGISAASERLAQVYGENWLAVGDAAAAFDPLSSQGMYNALVFGMQAGEALHAHLSGDATADGLAGYQAALDQVYGAYLGHRAAYYAAEGRWAERPFWQSRRGAIPPQGG